MHFFAPTPDWGWGLPVGARPRPLPLLGLPVQSFAGTVPRAPCRGYTGSFLWGVPAPPTPPCRGLAAPGPPHRTSLESRSMSGNNHVHGVAPNVDSSRRAKTHRKRATRGANPGVDSFRRARRRLEIVMQSVRTPVRSYAGGACGGPQAPRSGGAGGLRPIRVNLTAGCAPRRLKAVLRWACGRASPYGDAKPDCSHSWFSVRVGGRPARSAPGRPTLVGVQYDRSVKLTPMGLCPPEEIL